MGRTTFYQRNYIGFGSIAAHVRDYYNGDSDHWEEQANNFIDSLKSHIGQEAYYDFKDEVWPDDAKDLTWKQVYDMVYEAWFLARDGERNMETLVEAARSAIPQTTCHSAGSASSW